jgi:hypothetical protein
MPERLIPAGGGEAVDVPDSEVQYRLDRGWKQQSNAERASQVVETAREEHFNTLGNKARALEYGVARGVTGGLSDAAARVIGGDDTRQELDALREYNSGLSTIGEIGGALLPTGAGSLAARSRRCSSRRGGCGSRRGAGRQRSLALAGSGFDRARGVGHWL